MGSTQVVTTTEEPTPMASATTALPPMQTTSLPLQAAPPVTSSATSSQQAQPAAGSQASPGREGSVPSPTVLERWELGVVIGTGSYSNVYSAKDAAGCNFAVKVIFDNPKKPYLRDRAKREAEAMRKMTGHPNIIGLEEFVELPDRVCIVMPYVPAGTLLSYINSFFDPLPEPEVATILLQLVSALEYAHNHGWVHRDVKLENILRRADGTVVLADWGFASPWCPGQTITGSVGSPHYSAPEIVRNESYTGPEVDVWSLGVVLYALACNRLPFNGTTTRSTYEKILAGTFAPRQLSPPLLSLITSMLCVQRTSRASLMDVKLSLWMTQYHPHLRPLAKSYNANRCSLLFPRRETDSTMATNHESLVA